MQIFGKEIQIKQISCNNADFSGSKIPPSVNIFVKVTNGCNCHCKFCSNADCSNSINNFDLRKLIEVVREIQNQGIRINRMNITGGEPSITSKLVADFLEEFSNNAFGDIHIHLNTNGLLSQSQELMQNERWNSISVSLHHYDYDKLSEIYGTKISQEALHFEHIDRNKINVSCNLIKGYIDNSLEVQKMLDFTLALDIPRIGFVSLMKVNNYCKCHYVDFEEIDFEQIPNVYFTNSLNRGANCKCSNYLYNRNAKILEIYTRNYVNQLYCESALLYDGHFLQQGFYDKNIIF